LLQESGRAGNDGNESFAFIIPEGKVTPDFEPYLRPNCRHQSIATFYGETIKPCGTMCEICTSIN
jgi:hypothetical protein